MEKSVEVVELVSSLLDDAKYKEVLSVPLDEKYCESFKDNCSDLVSVVVGKIQDETIVIKPSLYGACEQLLAYIVQKAAPEEALLEFIEQVEIAKNDAQFAIVLTPLQALLKKLTAKRGRSLEWCLNSVSTYIETIPVPEHFLEGKERLLMDSDPNVRRISRVYALLPAFYRPFVNELNVPDANKNTKQIITAFLISLLGSPVIYIDLDPECNTQGELRQCCGNIIDDICILENDLIKFFELLDECCKEKNKSKSEDTNEEKSPYQHRDKVNLTSLSGLYYIALSGHFSLPDTAIPQVYCIEYIVHNALLSVIHLLTFTEYGPVSKALHLCKSLITRLPERFSHNFLTLPAHFNVCKALMNVGIYSTYESLRKFAVSLISSHVNKFEYKGRYAIVKYIIETANHSGMIGFAITLYKNSLNEAFKEQQLHDCFIGTQLLNIIKKMCHLPHGVESDLVELADQIITTLNFLRYLSLKDTQNLTGIRNLYPYIEDEYLDKLRTSLNMSKAHYEVKLKEIEEGKKHGAENVNVSINIGGNTLDDIPDNNKKEIIYSALNAFHLIEGLVARLSECININKMQNLNMDCDDK